ncbi:mandelate racemase/muconate lactonizing enzyme family protein [Pseudomonas syringae group genomosp. 3]|uniref:glucarate dehydratase n=1 Tax=Pseudomonas syringae pv. primulae TaxID=251707 RepID=A0A3M5TT63_9PSED|nr:mandelate racemase/muconate lactonizing enzyme family protein [Pseudomonas syringae group genomosp. 3]RMO67474.1 Mandelate racemase/muconate lactonizing protein [Pseudomonas syringae pv. primulae]RMU36801.1 Mandelate racemase/muconate lactonizing protein [Pseudomonas syringae pv. primulae]
MKIKRIKATPINLPLDAPYVWVFGELPGFSTTIIEVETEDGLVGLGEAPSWQAAAIIRDYIAPKLVGHDAFDIAGAEFLCLPYFAGVQSINDNARITAFGAVEMALWDLRGKAWGLPLYQVLGGAVRKDIPFTDYFSLRNDGPQQQDGSRVRGEQTPEAVADYCVMLNETYGTTFFEGKFSTRDPKVALRMLELIRQRLGDDVMLRIDSNQAYSLATARRLIRPLEELGVRNWEDPVSTIEEMVELRRHCSIPFSTHNTDIARAMSLKVPDAIVGNPAVLGGIGRLMRFIGACEHAGIDFWCYSGDSGVGSAVYLHLCAALGWIREPNQSLFRMQVTDVIEEGPFVPRNNTVRVPEGDGLGVTLSQEHLAYGHKHFLEHGPMNKYHDAQKPGTFRRLPLA